MLKKAAEWGVIDDGCKVKHLKVTHDEARFYDFIEVGHVRSPRAGTCAGYMSKAKVLALACTHRDLVTPHRHATRGAFFATAVWNSD